MTFDDDFVQIGGVRTSLQSLGLEWPPPAFMRINNHGELPDLFVKRLRLSEITDEERAEMTHVCRGAQYEVCSPADLPHDEPVEAQ